MDQFEKFFNKALRYLSYRPRSEKEVKDNLVRKKAPEEIIQKVVDKLKEQKFINDEEFASWFVKSRISARPKAARIIKMELKQKGIDQETIDNLQLTIDDLEAAKRLIAKKFDKHKSLKKQELYKKLGSFLARRGFNWDIIKKSIDEAFDKRV